MYQLCVYCGERGTCTDHIRPRSRGGNNTEANRVPCCQPCNSSKGNRLLTEWTVSRVLYGVSQDARIFAEILDLTGATEIVTQQTTVREQVYIASRLLRNRNKSAVRFIISQIEISRAEREIHGLMTLREISESGIVTISYTALRKAKSRDKAFPHGVPGSRGLEYSIHEIQEYLKSRLYRRISEQSA